MPTELHARVGSVYLAGLVGGIVIGSAIGGVVGAENLCDQAIFVDDATRAVMPPDPE